MAGYSYEIPATAGYPYEGSYDGPRYSYVASHDGCEASYDRSGTHFRGFLQRPGTRAKAPATAGYSYVAS